MNAPLKGDQARALQRAPVAFLEKVLGVETLWKKQKQIARSVVDNRVTAVRSCRGSGKTFLIAQLVLWWLFTRPNSAVITTAPTQVQVEDILWKEVRRTYNRIRSSLGGVILPQKPKLTVEFPRLKARSIAIGLSTNNPVNFSGWHAPGGVLAIIDEAPGVNPGDIDIIEGTLVAESSRMIAIGNPLEPSGFFYELFTKREAARHHISAFDVPNVVEGAEVIPGLATRGWVDSRRKAWGEDSPLWSTHVLGEFPDASDHTLIPLKWYELAVQRHPDAEWHDRPVIGVDVARFGPDSTVLAFRHPAGIRELRREPKQDTVATTGAVVRQAREESALEVHIDADGLGAGVFDSARAELGDVVKEMRGGMRAPFQPERFLNARAEWFWALREALDPTNPDAIALPDDDELRAQLTAIRWSQNARGLIKIESKDEMRKRGLPSPDAADAVAMAWARVPTEPEFFFI